MTPMCNVCHTLAQFQAAGVALVIGATPNSNKQPLFSSLDLTNPQQRNDWSENAGFSFTSHFAKIWRVQPPENGNSPTSGLSHSNKYQRPDFQPIICFQKLHVWACASFFPHPTTVLNVNKVWLLHATKKKLSDGSHDVRTNTLLFPQHLLFPE